MYSVNIYLLIKETFKIDLCKIINISSHYLDFKFNPLKTHSIKDFFNKETQAYLLKVGKVINNRFRNYQELIRKRSSFKEEIHR